MLDASGVAVRAAARARTPRQGVAHARPRGPADRSVRGSNVVGRHVSPRSFGPRPW